MRFILLATVLAAALLFGVQWFIARNLGGSVGIALLSTLLTRREQFHSERIGEAVTLYNLATQDRIQALTNHFTGLGFDPISATNQAYLAIANTVRREANIMAFNDCFFFIGIGLLAGGALVWLCRRPPSSAKASAH
jgi:DHA2 family multidrug resistance protein